jgi:hypothetical protein
VYSFVTLWLSQYFSKIILDFYRKIKQYRSPPATSTIAGRSGRSLVEIILEAPEDSPDFGELAEVCHGLGNGIVVFESEKRRGTTGRSMVCSLFNTRGCRSGNGI